jgi:glyoxylase-like metal-dependent hydrolase (beta-lactamase superfamily II)
MTENLKVENIVQPIKLGHVNIYLINTEVGYILVDTGMPNTAKKFDQALRTYGVEADQVSLIILTHGHLDHVGAVAQVKALTGGKILCHRSFAEDLSNGKFENATPQNLVGRVFNLMMGLLGSGIDPAIADIVVDDEYDLDEFGISGKVIHTPGHSQSSISIILDHGEALVGDLIREEKPGIIGFGMFYEDRDTALESVKKIATFTARIIYLSHSTIIDNQILNKFIAANQ